jgi:hypothetical protein
VSRRRRGPLARFFTTDRDGWAFGILLGAWIGAALSGHLWAAFMPLVAASIAFRLRRP